jgi:hypothetical protein
MLIISSIIGTTFAVEVDPIVQTKQLLDQYSTRVKMLESENALLRGEMVKAGIKIPLSAYQAAVTTTITGSINTGTVVTTTPTTPVVTTPSVASGEVSYDDIEKTHGPIYTGVIKRLHTDWSKIRDAYKMPQSAYIEGYEFVVTPELDHVFVDISYTGSTGTGIFDAKLLYQFDKKTFARKLIGFFELDKKTGFYTTKTGKNIFAGVKRTWIDDPSAGPVKSPVTPVVPPTTTPVVPTTTTPTTSTVSYSEIESAYAAKRFLSVISLSNTWLITNPPTVDVLRIRYRTYFIIAKYSEAIKEIEKIKSLGQLSSAIACEANVIATYAKDTTLADSYKVICNKK